MHYYVQSSSCPIGAIYSNKCTLRVWASKDNRIEQWDGMLIIKVLYYVQLHALTIARHWLVKIVEARKEPCKCVQHIVVVCVLHLFQWWSLSLVNHQSIKIIIYMQHDCLRVCITCVITCHKDHRTCCSCVMQNFQSDYTMTHM